MMSVLKNIFVLVGLLLVLGLGFYLYQTNGSLSLESSPENIKIEAESEDLVRKLNSIKDISINKKMFTDPRFTNLRTFATEVPDYPTGRNNPFLPSS